MTDHTVSSPSSEKAHQSAAPVIMLDEARLALSSAEGMVEILRGISLSIEAGETVGVLGPSGAGKTSLLMIMAGLESLTGGSISLAENDITTMGEDALAALRRDQVGIVFQAFRLIPSMTALQNVAVPMELAGRRDADEMAATALRRSGSATARRIFPTRCRAASSSALPLPVPSRRGRAFFWPTSRQAIWTAAPARRSSPPCSRQQNPPARRWFS